MSSFKMLSSLAVLLLLVSNLVGQSIKGVEAAKPGQLIVLSPVDFDEARTLWLLNYPDEFEQWQTESGKLFLAMPNHRVSFTLIVTPNDVSKPLKQIRHTIDVAEVVNPNPPIDKPTPDDPVAPPDESFKSSPLFESSRVAYRNVVDENKAEWAKQMADAFAHINRSIKDGKYSSIAKMMTDVAAANNGKLGLAGSKAWPDESRRKWVGFRDSVADRLIDLDLDGKLESPSDYVVHWEAIRQALLLEVK